MRIIFTILILTLILTPLPALALEIDPVGYVLALEIEPVGYIFASSVIRSTEGFILNLYDVLAQAFQALFTKLAVIFLIYHALRWQLGKPDPIGLIKFGAVLVAVNVIAFTPGAFEEWFYRPVMHTVYALPELVTKVATGTIKYNSFGDTTDPIKTMITSMDDLWAGVANVCTSVFDGSFWGAVKGFWATLQALFLYIIFLALYLFFVIILTFSIVSAHIILALAPFAISLFAFEKLRGFSFNVLRTFLGYALIPFFLAVIMGITTNSIETVVAQAEALQAAGDLKEIPASFFLNSFFMAGFTLFLLFKAPEFASQAIGGALSSAGSLGSNIRTAGIAAIAGAGIAKGFGKGTAFVADKTVGAGVRKGLQYTRMVADQIKQDRAKYSN